MRLLGEKKVQIGGISIEVVPPEKAEEATVVVCGPTSYFWDDVKTTCAACGREIVHRPTVPKKPPKVCMACAMALFPAEGSKMQ